MSSLKPKNKFWIKFRTSGRSLMGYVGVMPSPGLHALVAVPRAKVSDINYS